jgi:hypothetical protein
MAPIWAKLAEAQVKIRILCQYQSSELSDPPLTHKNLEWLQPFGRYGLRDVAALSRVIYDFKPNLTQLTFDLNEKMSGWVYWTIPELLRNIGASKVITSVHGELKSSPPLLLKYWMEMSSLVLIDSDTTEALLHAQLRPALTDKVRVVPPPPMKPQEFALREDWLTESFTQWVFAPGKIADAQTWDDLLNFHLIWLQSDPRLGLVVEVADLNLKIAFLRKLQGLGLEAQVVLLVPLSEDQRWQLISSCDALSLRHVSATEIEVRDWVMAAVAQNIPLFANGHLFSLFRYLKNVELLNQQDPFFSAPKSDAHHSLHAVYDQFSDELCNTYLRLYQDALV